MMKLGYLHVKAGDLDKEPTIAGAIENIKSKLI